MAWFKKPQYTTLQQPKKKDRIPDGMWWKCPECVSIIYSKDFEDNFKVCTKCGYHTVLSAKERIAFLFDEGTFVEDNQNIKPTDPLKFVDSKKYKDRLKNYQERTGLTEGVITGVGEIGGIKTAGAVMDFGFIGGSMGSVVGEKVTRTIERGIKEHIPVVIAATSGGARMQEGILSLMQMAKTSGALARLAEEKIPYICLLTNPTTAGVMASFASLGDVIIAEQNSLIGFAGPRVIQQTINQILPKNFQKSEFVLEHGFLDVVCHRKEVKPTIVKLLTYFTQKSAKALPKTSHNKLS